LFNFAAAGCAARGVTGLVTGFAAGLMGLAAGLAGIGLAVGFATGAVLTGLTACAGSRCDLT